MFDLEPIERNIKGKAKLNHLQVSGKSVEGLGTNLSHPRISKCWLKKSNSGRAKSTKGSNSGQKACGVQEEEEEEVEVATTMVPPSEAICLLCIPGLIRKKISSPECAVKPNVKYSGHNIANFPVADQQACSVVQYSVVLNFSVV